MMIPRHKFGFLYVLRDEPNPTPRRSSRFELDILRADPFVSPAYIFSVIDGRISALLPIGQPKHLTCRQAKTIMEKHKRVEKVH